ELPAGAYEVVTDEEMIEGLSFASWRRIATMINVPSEGVQGATEMLSIGSVDLADAQASDAQAADLHSPDLQSADLKSAKASVAHD
ncbi:hypothetical protein ACXYUI_28570, partial [Klebsiella pneumoniae]